VEVRLDPAKIRRKVQSVRSGVQAGCQIQHAVAPVGDRLGDGVVDDLGPSDQPPASATGQRRFGHDRTALLPPEALGEWIAKQRVSPR
jgi:hypothetical protein